MFSGLSSAGGSPKENPHVRVEGGGRGLGALGPGFMVLVEVWELWELSSSFWTRCGSSGSWIWVVGWLWGLLRYNTLDR